MSKCICVVCGVCVRIRWLTSAGRSVGLRGLWRRRHPSLARRWTISMRLMSSRLRNPFPGPCWSAGDTEKTYLRPQSHAMGHKHTHKPVQCFLFLQVRQWSLATTLQCRESRYTAWDKRISLYVSLKGTCVSLSFSLPLVLLFKKTRVGAVRKHLPVAPVVNRKFHNVLKVGDWPALSARGNARVYLWK